MEQMIYQSLPSTSLGLSSVGGTVSVCSIHHRWPSVWPSVSLSSFSSSCFRKRNLKKAKPLAFTPHHHHHQQPQNQEDEDFQVLTATRSHYNDIVILDTPKSRVLLLDSSRMSFSSLSYLNVFRKEFIFNFFLIILFYFNSLYILCRCRQCS